MTEYRVGFYKMALQTNTLSDLSYRSMLKIAYITTSIERIILPGSRIVSGMGVEVCNE